MNFRLYILIVINWILIVTGCCFIFWVPYRHFWKITGIYTVNWEIKKQINKHALSNKLLYYHKVAFQSFPIYIGKTSFKLLKLLFRYVSMGNSASDAKAGSGGRRVNQGSGKWATTGPHDINHELPEYIRKLGTVSYSQSIWNLVCTYLFW